MPKLNRGIGNWWNVDISDVKLDTLAPYAPAPADAGVPLPALSTGEEHSGLLIQRNSQPTYVHLSQQAADQGVIFTDLATAVREHADLVQPAPLRPRRTRHRQVHRAQRGALGGRPVPLCAARRRLDLPLHGLTWVDGPGAAIFGHTLIVAERFAAKCAWSKNSARRPATASARSARRRASRPPLLTAACSKSPRADGQQGRIFHHRELGAGGLRL